jgi:hypothetical protein
LIPEADQQVGGQADQLPAHEQEQDRVGNHYAQHRSCKQAQEAEKPREVLVVRHVAGGVDENEQAHKANHHQHHGRQRIENPPEIDVGRADANPGKVDGVGNPCIKTKMKEQRSLTQQMCERNEREKE